MQTIVLHAPKNSVSPEDLKQFQTEMLTKGFDVVPLQYNPNFGANPRLELFTVTETETEPEPSSEESEN